MSDSPVPPPSASEPAQLLDELLESLFRDFHFWFERGLVLLEHTPESLLPPGERQALQASLQEGLQAIGAARALRGACTTPMAVDLEAMAPWHRLMMRVWNLSSMLRISGVALPEESPPEPQT